MHPILARLERLAAYLGSWLLIGAMVSAVEHQLGLSWPEALALILPLIVFYSFECLSAWYVCRSSPLDTSTFSRVFTSAAVGAAIAAGIWILVARLWMAVLAAFAGWTAASDSHPQQLPILFTIGAVLYLASIAAHYAFISVQNARNADRGRLQMEVLSRDAELRALRAQIDPHFLFNSLNSISALTAVDATGARRMCLLLAEFLRETLDVSGRRDVSLLEELTLVDKFLSIEQVRFGDRLRVARSVDPQTLDCRVPPLILQPLVENAVTHGIAQTIEGGTIALTTSRRGDRLAISVENPCDAAPKRSRTGGVGLENVRRRLAVSFGKEGHLNTTAQDSVFRAELEMPCA